MRLWAAGLALFTALAAAGCGTAPAGQNLSTGDADTERMPESAALIAERLDDSEPKYSAVRSRAYQVIASATGAASPRALLQVRLALGELDAALNAGVYADVESALRDVELALDVAVDDVALHVSEAERSAGL